MATEVWKIENTICRCCHSEGSFHNLAEPRPYLGDKESYSEMLRECFNIVVTPMPGDLCSLTYSICNSCVGKLREASSFKKQVQVAEERFMELYYKNAIKVAKRGSDKLIKEEPETIDFKEEFLEPGDDDEDFKIPDDMDNSSEEDMDLSTLSAKGKGKGKRKVDTPPQKFKVKSTKVTIKQEKEDKEKKVAEQKKGNDMPKRRRRPQKYRDYYKRIGDRYQCSYCEMFYKTDWSISRHIKTKHGKPLFTCDICGEGFKARSPFVVHKLKEHDIDIRDKCKACDAAFNTPKSLKSHMNIVHMLGVKYKCDLCDYESYAVSAKSRHATVHIKIKKHNCKFCKKSFARRTTLLLHEKIHTGEKRKKCNECGAAFVQKASLNYHMMRHHPEVR